MLLCPQCHAGSASSEPQAWRGQRLYCATGDSEAQQAAGARTSMNRSLTHSP